MGYVSEHLKDIEGARHVVSHNLRVVGRRIHAGGGVKVAAYGLDLLNDIACAATRCTLKGHVLEEMRDAMLGAALVPAAGTDPKAERDGLDLWHGMADDRETLGQF